MVPAYASEPDILKKPSPPPRSLCFFRNTCSLLRSHFSSHHRFWLFITFLWIQALVISFVRTPTPCFPDRTTVVTHFPLPLSLPVVTNATQLQPASPLPPFTDECPSGRIYSYDLPSMFNRDLLLPNCTEIDPWNWQCGIRTNHGYGGVATELRRYLPENLFKSWYQTNQFSLELIFHHRILKHKCRTTDPESATAFYIPFYAGLAVGKFLWMNDTSKRDWHCQMMLQQIRKQNYWKKLNGSDHFLTIGRITWDFRRLSEPDKTWGSSFLNMVAMKKVSRFIIEKAPEDEQDISVPYPTGFHPKTKENLNQWQHFVKNYNRTSLFTFIGATTRESVNDDFRGIMLNYCRNESPLCQLVDCAVSQCSTDSWVILKALLSSDFCLQPKGDSFTRRSVFDCMVAGSVPVFFWKRTAYEQYEWFLPGDPESYSVFIDHEKVRNGTSIKQVLMNYSKDEIEKKREKVIETIPRIIYAKPNGGFRNFNDAFDIALDGVLERIKDEKEWTDILR